MGLDWERAASVEAPANFNGDAKVPPYKGDHPILRIPGQAILADVVAARNRIVAVGYVPPGWVPASWTSSDGASWSLHAMGATPFTFAVAVAAGADGTIVAAGRSNSSPVAWTSADGAAWTQHSVPVLAAAGGVAERMTTVIATDRGFLAGGSAGPELSDRHARFWTSTNGAEWELVPDDTAAFANAEVRAITRIDGGFAAVGVAGTALKQSGAVAWTSPDGVRWTRVDDPSFAGAVAVSVVAAPFGGLVAVGSELERREAVAWVSSDGRGWTRAPADASLTDPGYVWMTDIVAVGDEVIAVGGYQPLQRGTATSWVSHDGIHWDRARPSPVQEQAEFYALAHGPSGVIAVGSFGQPDSYAPRIWLSPER